LGNTPLHLAAEFDDLEAIQLLTCAGANVFAANREGNQPIAYAKSQEVENYLIGKVPDDQEY
jgi:ankyrin repeat protein